MNSTSHTTDSRQPRFWPKAVLALASALLCLAGIELVFRFLEPKHWYQSVEDAQFFNQKRDYNLNSWKLRDKEYTPFTPSGTYRIMMLGDSFTFGTGVFDDSRLFTEIIETRLNRDKPDPDVRQYEVLNSGIPGLLTDEWKEALLGPGRKFQPDMVVAVFFLRDGTTLGLRRNFFNPMREQMQNWLNDSLLARYSAAYRTLGGRLQLREMSDRYVEAFHTAYFGEESETGEWRRAQKNLLWMRNYCHNRGARFHLVVFPVLFRLENDYPFQRICDEILAFGRENGIPSFSLLPAFVGKDARSLWVSELDQHPNETGHRIVSDALEAYLRPHLTP